jgi:hypothetical protein
MNENELAFCEEFEGRANEIMLMDLLKDELTDKGREIYAKRKEWLKLNLDKYLEIKWK